MAKFYNQLKSQKGSAIGTILPWTGALTKIPSGWIVCDGAQVDVDDYPLLFQAIGYRYGGVGNLFATPRLRNRALVDFHPSHNNLPNIDMNPNFLSRIGEDYANLTSGASSNIDLRFALSPVNNFGGRVTDLGINPAAFSDELNIVPRALCDGHTGSHNHGGAVNSVGVSNDWVEECQQTFTLGLPDSINGFLQQDQCEERQFYAAESNGNSQLDSSSYVVPKDATGNTFGEVINSNNDNPFGNGQFVPQNNPNKNYQLNSDQTDYGGFGSGDGDIGCTVHFNHIGVNWGDEGIGSQSQGFPIIGHSHVGDSYEITQGNVNLPFSITTTFISTGSLEPDNLSNEGIATFAAENIQTPSLNIIHIIRAY